MIIDMRSYILKLHGLCMHSFYSILLVNQDASTILSMCIRAAHIKEDVDPWIYLSASVDVQFSHATIWREPEPDPSCGVDCDGKMKRVSEIIKGTVPRKSIILSRYSYLLYLLNADNQLEQDQRLMAAKKCDAR